LTNDDKILRYIRKRINNTNNTNDSESNVRKNNKKFNDLLCSIKTGMIVYFVIQFIFAVACMLYVTLFCAVYVGTKTQVFKTYAIALIEVLIIKIVYGIILGILRAVGLSKRSRIAYQIAYYLDKLLH
jgi:ABC-type proline/glycine betaine transport system permease subunit